MADPVPTSDLITLITSLISLGHDVATRLSKIAAETSDVAEPFRSLSLRLLSLTSALQSILQQVQQDQISGDVTTTLQSQILGAFEPLFDLNTRLSQLVLQKGTTSPQYPTAALRHLIEDDAIKLTLDHMNTAVAVLVTTQTLQRSDKDDVVLDHFSKLRLKQYEDPPVVHQHGHTYPNVSAHDHSRIHLGDVYYINQDQKPDEPNAFGLCIASAPLIDAENFIGRAVQLQQMAHVLGPGQRTVEQRRLVLGGMGGIGKTQLAIAYARKHQENYSSVFWINATTLSTLKASFQAIAQQLLPDPAKENLDDGSAVREVFRWLSDTKNTRWLLIFDNHDEPDLFRVCDYMPNTANGSIIVTTRLPDLIQGQQMHQVRVPAISTLGESLEILQTRSQRENLEQDPDARRLAERLAGLPLALATAGAYLRKTTLTFSQYLKVYDKQFNVNPRRPVQLQEYANKTLHTTWNLTFTRLESDDPIAAKALTMLAYFDHQDIWFELMHQGLNEKSPTWLLEVAEEHIDFENTLGVLVDYCLLDAHPESKSYSIHSCVHDWTLAELNKTIDEELYWYAVGCVTVNIEGKEIESLDALRYARLTRHASRYTHLRFTTALFANEMPLGRIRDVWLVSQLLRLQSQYSAAEVMSKQAIAGYEKTLGPNHSLTVKAYMTMGVLYCRQGKLKEAEEMYKRALAPYGSGFEVDGLLTTTTLNNLGLLYNDQGRLKEAGEMYERAIRGYEATLGPSHPWVFNAMNSLAELYRSQGKQQEAEEKFNRVLIGIQTTLGSDHYSLLDTLVGLGNIYRDQGKLEEAEEMYGRALDGNETLRGLVHPLTLRIVHTLAILYSIQGKVMDAEHMYKRALSGHLTTPEPDNLEVSILYENLGCLYHNNDDLIKAEENYLQALAGYETIFGRDHDRTLYAMQNLATLFRDQGKLVEAEQLQNEHKILWRKIHMQFSP